MPRNIIHHLREGWYNSEIIGMTEREKELAEHMVRGLNNREIAAALFIAEGTVRNYINKIYGKLDVVDRAQAIIRLQRLL